MKSNLFKLLFVIGVLVFPFGLNATEKKVVSPDGNIEVVVKMADKITYEVNYKKEMLISPSSISMDLGFGDVLGLKPKLAGSKVATVNEKLIPVVREKRAKVSNHYNELTLAYKGGYKLLFRVFDDGVAYRWVTTRKGQVTVYGEEANFSFASNQMVYFPQTKGYFTAFQHTYKYLPLDSIADDMMCITPALVDVEKGPKVAITEADLRDYPGMFLKGSSEYLILSRGKL